MASYTNRSHSNAGNLATKGAPNPIESTLHHDEPEDPDGEQLLHDNQRSKAALPPHEKLPAELLQSIFRCCNNPSAPLDTHSRKSAKHPAFTLMKVCTVWRQAALNTHELWSNVRTENDPRDHALTTRWLSRAGMIPRTLSIRCCFPFPSQPDQSIPPVLLLISQFPFRYLNLTFSYDGIFQFSNVPIASFLSLEELRLYYNIHNGIAEISFYPHSLPNLRSLSIGGHRGIKQIRHPLAWPNLSNLHLDCVPPSECLDFLRLAPGLEICFLYISSPNDVTSNVDHVVASCIKDLHIISKDGSNTGLLVDALTVPNLETLSLGEENRLSNPMACSTFMLEQLAMRSGFQKLQNIIIHETLFPLNIGRLLQCMPSLQNMKLYTDTLLDEETAERIASGQLGPHLSVLHFLGGHNVQRVITMIETRRKGAQVITDVLFETYEPYEDDEKSCRQRIDRLKMDGVSVTLAFYKPMFTPLHM